jgi:hypothetical protein
MILERIRDFVSLFIAGISSYIYFTNGNYRKISHCIATYLLVDLFINKKIDMYIHHAIGLMLYSFVHMNQLSEESENILMKPFIAVEISSIFYNINYLYPKNYFSALNNLLFITTFFYYRIYNYYYSVIKNEDINHIIENTGEVSKYYYYSAIYNLYILNLYWFSKIMKIVLKKIL